MDFSKLLEPYADPMEDGRPKRTVEAQIKWLIRKNIPKDIIDQAILKVFNELESGKEFENGHELDQHLLSVAQEMHQSHLSKQAKELEAFMNKFKENAVQEYIKQQRLSLWKRIKAVFRPL